MLGELTRQDKADCCLNLPGGDCGLLVVASQRCSLHSNLLENISNERVQYRHGLGRDTSVWVDLLQDLQGRNTTCKLPVRDKPGAGYDTSRASTAYLVDVDLVALNSLLGTLLPATSGFLCDCLLGGLSRFFVSGLRCHRCCCW